MLVKLAAIFFSMILVNNYVLVKFYGICPFLGVSKKLDSSIGMSGAVIFVMLVATAVTFPIQIFVLNPADLGYLQTIVFILVIAVLVQFIEIFLKKYVVALYNSLGVYLPLITTNCCVLAVTILVVDDYGADVATLGFAAAYIEALVCAVGAGVGFMRPPFGVWQKNLERKLDVMPVLWTIDPLDWTTDNEDEIINKVVTQAGENDIILLHDCYESSVNAALRIVDILQKEGFEFVTVDELIMN